MNYKKTIDYLYLRAPMFQQQGQKAYKTGLETTEAIDTYFSHPHTHYKTIHIAGTNGKGSTAHFLASILQSAGYKVGLYTSPHLKDFRERIRINGKSVSEQAVIDFVEKCRPLIETLKPSFFEVTTIMAFKCFADAKVDIAVVEVGLGGRLDCTNIISPELSVITNISFDHMAILGDTLEKIAGEKAGIIKHNTPVIIGETQPESAPVFIAKAKEMAAPITFADQIYSAKNVPQSELRGIYEAKNRVTAYAAACYLKQNGWHISDSDIANGFMHVVELTNFMGRWQQLGSNPKIICDTGHNEAGITFVTQQLALEKYDRLHIVIGVVKDKDINHILALLPKNAIYYFTKAQIPRALDEHLLQEKASAYGLHGNTYSSIPQAFEAAKKTASPNDFIFVGGSNFTVAEIL